MRIQTNEKFTAVFLKFAILKPKIFLPVLLLVFLTSCGGVGSTVSGAGQVAIIADNISSAGSVAEQQALNDINKEEFERNAKNLPGAWKGMALRLSVDTLTVQGFDAAASFWNSGNQILGQVSINPCLPPITVS